MAKESDSVHPRLVGFPESVQEDYSRFIETKDSEFLVAFVLSALGFLCDDQKGSEEIRGAADEARLIEDFHIDSLAVAELVFLLEDLFSFSISNEELMEMQTIGDLKRVTSRINERAGDDS